mmetsp:Transcript_362/g.770  ORF Transcript_362/g.770 Transcript_362/m.770 type:complete len:226 (-) Transcript_362:1075-1752(-)
MGCRGKTCRCPPQARRSCRTRCRGTSMRREPPRHAAHPRPRRCSPMPASPQAWRPRWTSAVRHPPWTHWRSLLQRTRPRARCAIATQTCGRCGSGHRTRGRAHGRVRSGTSAAPWTTPSRRTGPAWTAAWQPALLVAWTSRPRACPRRSREATRPPSGAAGAGRWGPSWRAAAPAAPPPLPVAAAAPRAAKRALPTPPAVPRRRSASTPQWTRSRVPRRARSAQR